MKFHIWTIGCQMNEADARQLDERLRAAGHQPCDDPRDADLVILNSCVVRQSAEDRVRARLREALAWKRRRAGRQVALMGCLVGHRERDARRLAGELPGVDFLLPPSDPSALLAAVGVAAEGCAEGAAPAAGPVRANVPVVLGCSRACTYCVIPYRRGRERSRPRNEVLAEVVRLVERGVREVVLLGQIVDRYGVDRPGEGDLADLLRDVARTDVLRVRFLTNHPSFLTDRLLEAVAETAKVCPHFEIPAQSGDDEILARMRRGYTADEYRRTVERIRRRLPGAAVHSDFIVGFPGESDAQFEATVRLVEEMRFDKIHVARYSPRPDTLAARRWPDDVPEPVKEERRRRLDELQTRIQREQNAAALGQVVEVLVDGRDERRGRWRGRTPQDRIVFFEDPRHRLGDLALVRITWTGPHSLIGQPEDPLQPREEQQ
ncbi:MAG: MiaB/RimO family radical SAM methylthiotransferase [Kiritimatiellae bacterium]|nr:MiaB/RimO family radical SAM methylthiotransferase [Kiritimatiellia bacterium]